MQHHDRTALLPPDTAPEDWDALVRSQAMLLDTIVSQLETACRTLHQSRSTPTRARQAQQRLARLLAQTKTFLQEQAHTPVTLERQLAQLHACPSAVMTATIATRIAQMEWAITTLHTQLTATRQRIARLTATRR